MLSTPMPTNENRTIDQPALGSGSAGGSWAKRRSVL
jgi:hypothetical protein